MFGPITDMLNSINTGTFTFGEPDVLWLVAPMVILLALIMAKSFVAIDKRRLKDPKFIRGRRYYRIFIFMTRTLIFALLFVALADPFGEVKTEIPGDVSITLLIDNSSSMDLFDTSFVPQLQAELEEYLPVKIGYISSEMESDIGDGILDHLEKDRNVLLVTDGQTTAGTELMDVLLFAASLNSSISTMALDQKAYDIGVTVKGPSKTISEVENFYKVNIDRSAAADLSAPVRLVVGVDDEVVFDDTITDDEYLFSRNFSDGYHRIVARIVTYDEDRFADNNVYYKTTHVIPKPKILFVTEAESALKMVLDELYDVTMVMDVPKDKEVLDQYYAVVINDLPITRLKDISALSDYVIEGNGLFVVGGYNSFDNGGYKGSAFESMLPVRLGTGERRKGESSLVIVLDMTGATVKTGELSTSKAMAYDVISRIDEKNSVGVVAFDTSPYLVADLEPLFVSKAQTLDKVERLIGQGGQSDFKTGLIGAFQILRGTTGSKNVIFISDGYTWNDLIRQEAIDVAKAMKNYGIKLYTVGMGNNLDERFLRELTTTGGGIYFTADTSNKLQILFGEAKQTDAGSAFGLFIIDPYHFITEDLDVSAVLYGYNQVVPKANAQLLVTTDSGEPAVVTWRHGLGRVATLTVFSSGNNLGELLDKDNSRLLTRIINWAIADPERKNDFFVDVKDARVNKTAEIVVRSKTYPKVKGLEFAKIEKDTYRSYYVNDDVGFRSMLGAVFGVNYDREHQELGYNRDLDSLVASSYGKTFTKDQVEEIVQHVKSVSRRVISEKKSFRMHFIIAALILLMTEIVIRRIRETWFHR